MKKYPVNYFQSQSRITGGLIYESLVTESLRSLYDVKIYDITNVIGISDRLERIFKNILIKKDYKINIRNFISTIDIINTKKQINISIFHHFDPSINKQDRKKIIIDKLLYTIYFKNLRKMDAIVVVSKYWKEFLQNKGFDNIRLIYNSFDMSKLKFGKSEFEKFIQKYNLSKDRKIIYLGVALSESKGVQKAFERLKNFKFKFCATGTKNNNGDIKILNLSYKEYIMLLFHCDLVLSLSEFKEGWNRVSHEALLLKTPVIGSGLGGMKELLENSGQIICDDINKLPECVEMVFNNYQYFSKIGYNYVKQFNKQYFQNSWDSLIRDLIQKKGENLSI